MAKQSASPSLPQAEPTTQQQQYADTVHSVFTVIDSLIGVLNDPQVLALLPAKYRGYAVALVAVSHVAENVAG
jgi:hypothetical protein